MATIEICIKGGCATANMIVSSTDSDHFGASSTLFP
jgi:hypothetical protein